MVLRKTVLVLAAIAIAATTAHAQFGVYGTFNVNELSGIKGSPATAPCTTATAVLPNGNACPAFNDSVDPLGGGGGVYYDFLKLGPVKLGADLRGSITHTKRGAETASIGTGARLYSGLGGVRAVFHTRFVPLRPYLQGSAGIGRTDYGVSPISTTSHSGGVNIVSNFQYMGYAGLDITVLPIMDFRLVEFGYGGLNPMGNNSHNYPIKAVSSGIVFHLPF
jgi:hypothetical protein